MDTEVKELRESYKWETDEELERKRQVYRGQIVYFTQDEILAKAAKVEENQARYEALSKIIRGRELYKRVGGGLLQWLGFVGPFVLGLLTSDLFLAADCNPGEVAHYFWPKF